MYLISGALLGYGLYQILYVVLKIPDETMIKLEKRFRVESKKSFLANLEDKIYYKIINYIKFDDIKKRKLEKVFFLANIEETPEQYYAIGLSNLISKIILSFATILIDFLLETNISIIAIVGISIYGIMNFMKYIKKPYKEIEKNKLEIEEQMYPFVLSVEQELLIDTDVIRILENFKGKVSGSLKKHLEITISEARVSNIINALMKMESRINSTMVSDVIRGLISLSRGESNREYFSMLSSSFKSIYINQKRKEASILPSKITKYSFALVIALIILIIGAMLPLVLKSSFL